LVVVVVLLQGVLVLLVVLEADEVEMAAQLHNLTVHLDKEMLAARRVALVVLLLAAVVVLERLVITAQPIAV